MDAPCPAPHVLLADQGHDSDHTRASLEAAGAAPMIPARKNPVRIDGLIHAPRHRIARCCTKLRCSRRPATRHDKTADSYPDFIQLASIRMWFRHLVNRS